MRAYKLKTLGALPKKYVNREPAFERLCTVIRGHDLQRLAKKSDVAASTLYYWTEGKTRAPRISTMAKVAKAVGFRLDLVADRKKR